MVLDTSHPQENDWEWFDREHTVVALNKIDLPCRWSADQIKALEARHSVVPVSATELVGLDSLRRAVIRCAGALPRDALPALTTARQHDSLTKVEESLGRALTALRANTGPELIAVDVRAALDHIGAMTGMVTSENVLDAVFSEFCIGK